MDLSALIFVALAVAWAVYLIPKALKQHEDSAASRSIDGFSDRLRVLARREPVDATTARLVVHGAKQDTAVTVSVEVAPERPAAPVGPVQVRARRAAAARAAKRRLRVVCVILLGIAVVGLLSVLGQVQPAFTFIPVGLLAAWLVACRLMVRSERASDDSVMRRPVLDETAAPATTPSLDEDPATEEIAVVHVEADLVVPAAEAAESPATPEAPRAGGWDPVPVTLPTYVAKEPAARRTVRTIDLDSTGVWTSGPLAADSELAREADQAERTAKDAAAEADRRRASGS